MIGVMEYAPEIRRCYRCDEPFTVARNGKYSHACADGKLVVAGTSYEDFDIYAELIDPRYERKEVKS